jgi:GNAT superfamily N-acetyltransferase
MEEGDLASTRDLIARSPFFRDYGLDPDVMGDAISSALNDEGMELHVALIEARLAGFSWVSLRGGFDRSPYLRLLAVDEAHKRCGVGRALMEALEARHAEGCDLLLLVTETNEAARRFYASLGYEEVGALPDYVKDGTTECLYRKRL